MRTKSTSETKKGKATGAKIIVETLKRLEVEVIFGLPGGVVLLLYDELIRDGKIRHVLVRHEQGATHMAEGYAKAKGKPGVVLVTSGPGATNCITGIADAYMDSVPLFVITGQVNTFFIGSDAFQETDSTGITRPITKYNTIIMKTEKLAYELIKAYEICKQGRPGPVVVDIPKDVISGETDFVFPEAVEIPEKFKYEGNEKQIRTAVELIFSSKRPIIYGGGGIILSGAYEELAELVDILGIPVTLTLMGLGGFDGTRPEFLGMLGMHGTYTANMAINNSDLILAVGARFDDRVTGNVEYFAPLAKIIHIDIDPASISKNIDIDVPIVGDAKRVLKRMIEIIKNEVPQSEIKAFRERIKSWWDKINEWNIKYPLRYKKSDGIIKPQELVETTYELTKNEKVIITTDVGQHQMWAAQYYKVKEPRTFLTSGGLGTMGSGFPAAIGAKIAKPERLVICFAGDGSFQMNMQELSTAVEEKVGVKVIIFNNNAHGMVTQWQREFYGRRYSASVFRVQPDYKKLAEAFGAIGFEVSHPSQLKSTLEKALFETPDDVPVIVDVKVDPEEDVYPMVPPGSPPTEMLLS
ncbi:Acetolactate synthase isozyme 3 large subunit [bacterium HR19]|nr:Acetolactate synthase isozyme 3 large subunit [bacterium HR19]